MMPDSNSVAIFSYLNQDVRVVTIADERWWVAADVTRALGLGNGRDAVGRLDQDGVGNADVIDSMGRRQSARVLNEPALYELIFQSRVPQAVQFRRWVTHTVLPELRQTGVYSLIPTTPKVPQTLSEALREFAAEIDAHEATKAELAEAAPRAQAWDAIASAVGDYSVGDAAKMLARAGIDIGPQRLFNTLAALKWTFRGEANAWRAYADRVEKGYLAERPQFHFHPKTGERVVDPPQLRVTMKGIDRLRVRLHAGSTPRLQAVSA
jgi:anti-repressor protein